jgi:hypothetical protein
VQGFGGDIYHELFYYVRIRRRTLSYSLNLIIPSLIISVMTVLGFTLPPNACEKITLGTREIQFPINVFPLINFQGKNFLSQKLWRRSC